MAVGEVLAEETSRLLGGKGNLVVVFAGLPPLSPPLAEKLTARSLKLLAVCGYGPTVRRWLEAHVLAAAVVPRFGELPAGTPAPKTANDCFSQEFEMLTPESIAQLPY